MKDLDLYVIYTANLHLDMNTSHHDIMFTVSTVKDIFKMTFWKNVNYFYFMYFPTFMHLADAFIQNYLHVIANIFSCTAWQSNPDLGVANNMHEQQATRI